MLLRIPKPAISKQYLLVISGIIWSIAGIILIERAYIWLSDFKAERLIIVALSGILLGLVFYFAGFIKLARKNIKRIISLPDQVCIFAFTAWKGYLIIAIMVTCGIILRQSSISKHYLAVFYVAMGIALIMGSILFHINYFKNISKGK